MMKVLSLHIKPVVWFNWLIFFAGVSVLHAAESKISSIQFVGVTYFSERELLETLPMKEQSLFTQAQVQQSLEALCRIYTQASFFSLQIDSLQTNFSHDSSHVTISFYLTEGKQTFIAQLNVTGNARVNDAQLRSLMDTKVGAPLKQDILENDIRVVLEYYNNNGFPLAKISPQFDYENAMNEVHITLHIDEEVKVCITEISVEGNSTTKNYVVAREARLSENEIFAQKKFERMQRRLQRLQIFSSVSEPQVYLTDMANDSAVSNGGVLFTVQEGNANMFDGVLGYVPSATTGGDGYLTGAVNILLRNILGTGRKASVRWQRETATTQELELHYTEPWLGNIPLTASVAYFQRKQDSSYVKNSITTRTEYALSDELSVALSGDYESVYPSASLQQFSVFESSTLSYGVDFSYDTRNNVRVPTSGVRCELFYQRGTKTITGPEQYLSLAPEKKYSIEKTSFALQTFYSPLQRNVIALGVYGKQLISNQIELSDMYQFGGTTTVRGYREKQFYGSTMEWLNLEYRFLLDRSSSLFAFFDAGYFTRPAITTIGIAAQEKYLQGIGVGARIETNLGVISVSYALGQGDTFSNGKIHFGIVNEF